MYARIANLDFHHLFHWKVDKDMVEVATFRLFSSLGTNIVLLSLPFYLYAQKEFFVWQIMFFFFVAVGGYACTVFFSGKIINSLGIKHSMALGSWCNIVYWLGISFLLQHHANFWDILLLGIPFFLVQGLGNNAKKICYDLFLTHHEGRNKGQLIAWMQIAITMSSILAPILGALITKNISFQYTVYATVFFLIISIIIVYLTPDHKFQVKYNIKKLTSDFWNQVPRKIKISEFCYTFGNTVYLIFWPLFLLLVLENIVFIGILVGVSSGVAMVISFFTGKYIDKQSKHPQKINQLFNMGLTVSSTLNLIKGFWWNPLYIGVIQCIELINAQCFVVPYENAVYKWIKKGNLLENTHIRTVFNEFSSFVVMGVITLYSYLFFIEGESNYIFFIIGFVAHALVRFFMGTIQWLK